MYRRAEETVGRRRRGGLLEVRGEGWKEEHGWRGRGEEKSTAGDDVEEV